MLNEGNQIHNFISSSGLRTFINYCSCYGFGYGSTTLAKGWHISRACFLFYLPPLSTMQERGGGRYRILILILVSIIELTSNLEGLLHIDGLLG
jgi:hypothetical protein